MIRILKQSAYKYGYLFITAAWLYTVSFLFTNYLSFDATPEKVARTLSAYVEKKENHFNDLIKDSVWVHSIVSGKAHVRQSKFKSDETGIFAYRINLSWWMFALSGLLAILIAVFTISYHAMRAALANPITSLRSE